MAKKKLTSAKAKEMLKNPPHGKPLTEKQRKFFGAVASGKESYEKAQLGNLLQPITMDDVSGFLDLFSVPQKALTKLITGKYQTPSEAMGIKNKVGAFATDMILDPVNLLGAGIVGKSAKVAKATKPTKVDKVTKTVPQKNVLYSLDAYSANPSKFQQALKKGTAEAERNIQYSNDIKNAIAEGESWKFSPEEIRNYNIRKSLEDEMRGFYEIHPEQTINLQRLNPESILFDFQKDKFKNFGNTFGGLEWKSKISPYASKSEMAKFKTQEEFLKSRTKEKYQELSKQYPEEYKISPLELASIPKNEQGGSIESRMGGLTDKGFNYNGAWGGQFQMGGSVLPGAMGNMYARTGAPSEGKYAKKTMPSAAEGYDVLPDPTDPERKYKLSAVVASAKDILNPLLRKKNPKAYDEWEAGRVEALRKGMPAVEEYYQKNPLQQFLTPSEVKSALSQQRKGLYEDYVGALKDLREYEEISPFQRVSLVGQMEEEQPIESLNYGWRFATQPVNISRIVENKPEESFSYSYNPKTGEYTKLPSMAGGGKMMSYYQAGLDFQPKTISENGIVMKKNFKKAQPGLRLPRVTAESTALPANLDPRMRAAIAQDVARFNEQKRAAELAERMSNMPVLKPASSKGLSKEEINRRNKAEASRLGLKYNEKTGRVESPFSPQTDKALRNLSERTIERGVEALDYASNLPGRLMQSSYNPNYTAQQALSGEESDAGALETLLSDPTNWATLGAKGLTKAALKALLKKAVVTSSQTAGKSALAKKSMLAPLLSFYKSNPSSDSFKNEFQRQVDDLKTLVSSPSARKAFARLSNELTKDSRTIDFDPDYAEAISDPSLPIKAIDRFATMLSTNPADNMFTTPQIGYLNTVGNLHTDFKNIGGWGAPSIPYKEKLKFLIDNSEDISPRDIIPFFRGDSDFEGMSTDEKIRIVEELYDRYSGRTIKNPLAEYTAGVDFLSLVDTYDDKYSSLSDEISKNVRELSRIGEKARPTIEIEPYYFQSRYHNDYSKQAIPSLFKSSFSKVPTASERKAVSREIGKKVLGKINSIITDPYNKGEFYTGAHSLSTDSYPMTLAALSRHKDIVDYVPIHEGSPIHIGTTHNPSGGLSGFLSQKRHYLNRFKQRLDEKFQNQNQQRSSYLSTPTVPRPLQFQLFESPLYNYHINKFNEKIGTNMPSAYYSSLENDLVRPNVGIVIKKKGGVVKDNAGYWNPENWGKPVEIDSNVITMDGVYEPLLGVSNTGDTQMMYPREDYVFDGESVTEYPMARNGVGVNQADEFPLEKLDNLTNFTNYNNMAKAKKGKGIPRADTGMNAIMRNQLRNPAMAYNQQTPGNKSLNMQNLFTPENIGAGFQAGSVIGQNVQKVLGALEQRRNAKQLKALAPVIEEASGTRDIDTQRYLSRQRNQVRPEDNLLSPDQMAFPSYGTGYDVLGMAEDGMQIGGNLTEIQNTYAPNTLYDNLGYEPLDESSRVKQFDNGGNMPKAQLGETLGMINRGINLAGDITAGLIGIGTKRMNKQSQQMLETAGFQSGMQGLLQNQYGAYMEDGGWVSHDWQPQVITKFGEYSVKDLLVPPKDADMLRAGGNIRNIRSNYMGDDEKLSMMQMGGQLQTHWGGQGELMSYNPYMPGSGETVMLRGNSHEESDGRGNTGIGMSYGGNMVEAERGEPVVEMQEGGNVGDTSAVVYGNMKIPSYGASELQDSNAKGKKFKTYAADLSKKELKQNKKIEKAIELINNIDGDNPFDMLKFNSVMASLTGADMKLRNIAQKKMIAAGIQSAILDTAEEFGLESDALARGKIKQARMEDLQQAQNGMSVVDYLKSKNKPFSMADRKKLAQQAGISNYKGSANQNIALLNYLKGKEGGGRKNVPSDEEITKQFFGENPPISERVLSAQERLRASGIGPKQTPYEPILGLPKEPEKGSKKKKPELVDYAKMAYNEILPYIRPMNQMQLSPEQLMGEMFALSTNVLEPVQAQTYQPMLETRAPQMTAQAMLNENQASFNALARQIGNNPAALSVLAAQKQKADTQAIAQVEAANQAQRQAVAARNISTLNDATLKNLSAMDLQFQRQAGARATTKAQAQAALNSIASKIGQNKLENLTSGVMQNMYNFRFGPKGRIINYNPLIEFDTDIESPREKVSRNGSIVKSTKKI